MGQAFLEVTGRRDRVGAIPARDHECGDIQPHQIFRLGARSRVPVEQQPAHALDDQLVSCCILTQVLVRERRVPPQHGDPRAAARVLAKALGAASCERDDGLEAVLLHVCQVLRKPQVAVDTVSRAADGPVEHQARRDFRMGDGQRHRRATTHARAHHVGAGDLQKIQQPFPLRGVVRPCDPLDAAA